LEDIDVDRR